MTPKQLNNRQDEILKNQDKEFFIELYKDDEYLEALPRQFFNHGQWINDKLCISWPISVKSVIVPTGFICKIFDINSKLLFEFYLKSDLKFYHLAFGDQFVLSLEINQNE